MSRWEKTDLDAMAEMRRVCSDDLSKVKPFPEVVGDRRIHRWIRSAPKLPDACANLSKHLQWRIENKIDDIRNDIVFGGKTNPSMFPHGERILRLCPQIVLSATARDKTGRPIMLEQYSFNPKVLLQEIGIKDFLVFFYYVMEYRYAA